MEIEERIVGLEGRISGLRSGVRACVRELLIDDGARFLVAERLASLGTAVVPSVHELIDDVTTPQEVRTLAALVGARVGDTEQSALVLFEELERGGEFAALAARTLASSRAPGAAQAIARNLRNTPLEERDLLVSYLDALRELGETLGPPERQRLETGDVFVRSAVAEWFPVVTDGAP
jgi:hypothetical protein